MDMHESRRWPIAPAATDPDTRASRRRETAFMAALTGALAVLLYALPGIDLAAAGLFYDPQRGGFFSPLNEWWLALPYHGMPILGRTTMILVFIVWGLGFFWQRLRRWRVYTGFLLCVALAGPHFIVGELLKDQSGRARPTNIVEFGGSKTFTPAFVFTDQCRQNCAFVSGHVASAAFTLAFGWLAAPAVRRRWLVAGTAFAAVMGLARMAQGGHFLSDVVFAYFTVYWVSWAMEKIFRRLGWLRT